MKIIFRLRDWYRIADLGKDAVFNPIGSLIEQLNLIGTTLKLLINSLIPWCLIILIDSNYLLIRSGFSPYGVIIHTFPLILIDLTHFSSFPLGYPLSRNKF